MSKNFIEIRWGALPHVPCIVLLEARCAVNCLEFMAIKTLHLGIWIVMPDWIIQAFLWSRQTEMHLALLLCLGSLCNKENGAAFSCRCLSCLLFNEALNARRKLLSFWVTSHSKELWLLTVAIGRRLAIGS